MNIARFVTGWVSVKITGTEPEKALYALAERGIAFWEAVPPKDFAVTFKTTAGAAKLIGAVAPALGCEMQVLSRHGLPAFFRAVSRRWALLLFLAVTGLLLFWSTAFVWDIRIEGNETISDGTIRQTLAQCGVDIGAYWPDFSQDRIRNSVILRLPGIRWMTVSMQGCRAIVTVREVRTPIEPVQEDEFVNIVAEKAGLVTEIYPLRGTAVTAVKRAVLPGETLIGGYATGRFGVQGATRAIGTVIARTWYELTAVQPATVGMKVYTEQTTKLFGFVLGGNHINFYKGSSICPVDCDKIIEEHTLGWDGVFTLPVTLEIIRFSAYETQTQRAEELREELEQMLMAELLSRLGDEGTITEATFTSSEEDGLVYVTLRAECSEQIGTEVPLSEEELLEIQKKIPDTEETDS